MPEQDRDFDVRGPLLNLIVGGPRLDQPCSNMRASEGHSSA